MVFQAMELIRQNLDLFLRNGITAGPDLVILGNIAYSTPDNNMTPADESAQVYMSLVNVEEEASLRNQRAVRQSDIRPLAYVNPPTVVNLYILFTSNHKDYNAALKSLGSVLLFMQGNKTFSFHTTPVTTTGVFATLTEQEMNMKIYMDLMSLTFEQVNHLWGSLGGKQMPFLLFKARQVEIDAERMLQTGTFISEIEIN
jgi:hypothetical protein